MSAISVPNVPQNQVNKLVPDIALPVARPTKDVASIAALIKAAKELDSKDALTANLAKIVKKELQFVAMAADILEAKGSTDQQKEAINLLRLQYGGDLEGTLEFAEVLRETLQQRAAARNMEHAINAADSAKTAIGHFDKNSVFGHDNTI